MPEPYCLTDLVERSSRHRMVQGYASSGHWLHYGKRALRVAYEVTAAVPRDLRPPPTDRLQRFEQGAWAHMATRSLALYVHYSASGRVSQMVLSQIDDLRRTGFAVVFISMAPSIPAEDWEAVRRVSAWLVQRVNYGLDFGAWRDLLPEARRRPLDELMLVNDSMLGPIYPFEPVLATMRGGGSGLFGLTESYQGGVHLQSYMLLARGKAAVADVMQFIDELHISHSKWVLVRRGELRLARWMLRRGHRVAAVFGYDRLIQAALADPAERETRNWLDWPLNPTHHLWHILLRQFGFPFLKTELILRNPGRIANVAAWPRAIPATSPIPLSVLQNHLKSLT
jgi:lipopolysaccharide biosynthesis protein